MSRFAVLSGKSHDPSCSSLGPSSFLWSCFSFNPDEVLASLLDNSRVNIVAESARGDRRLARKTLCTNIVVRGVGSYRSQDDGNNIILSSTDPRTTGTTSFVTKRVRAL